MRYVKLKSEPSNFSLPPMNRSIDRSKHGAFWRGKGTITVESCLRALCPRKSHICRKRELENPANGELCMLVLHGKTEDERQYFYFTSGAQHRSILETQSRRRPSLIDASRVKERATEKETAVITGIIGRAALDLVSVLPVLPSCLNKGDVVL